MAEDLHLRIHGSTDLPTLIYLPGLHGDWTLISRFRAALAGRVRLVEVTYPRRLDWSLADHGRAIVGQLVEHGIERAWLLGESFGSQVAWAIVEQTDSNAPSSVRQFTSAGMIMAGGFVRHCSTTGVRFVRECGRRMPFGLLKFLFELYGRYVQFRYRDSPEAVASIKEFVARRTDERDRIAITHRYGLILQNDLRPVARRTRLPVYCLCAMLDHLVPWPLVVPWLKRNCPGYRGARILFWATHNTLASAPKISTDQILKWVAEEEGRNEKSVTGL